MTNNWISPWLVHFYFHLNLFESVFKTLNHFRCATEKGYIEMKAFITYNKDIKRGIVKNSYRNLREVGFVIVLSNYSSL
jgi:hypothetical protein